MQIFTNQQKGENQFMKKQIKWTAALSTAAIMTALTPSFMVPAMAQTTTGWVEENGTWMFYDTDGYYLTDTWKKQDGEWFYLDENGQLAFDRQIDEYYVGTDGKRVINQWVKVANEDDWYSNDDPEFYWYYYGRDGKATVSKFKVIEEKGYYFDGDGRMVTGLTEIDGATYYFGEHDDGVMKKGWVQLSEDNEQPDDELIWRYFDSNGKMVENQIDKKISGDYYTFTDGKMQTGWYKLPKEVSGEDATASNADNAGTDAAADAAGADTAAEETPVSAAGYQYYDEDGKRASGWRTIEGISGLSEEGELYRFYFKNGKPYFSESGIQVFSIGSAKYGFNTKGEMQTELQEVTLADGSTANFYFGTDGVMKTGRQTIYNEEEGVNEIWFFHNEGSKKGQGYHGIRDNVIYEQGRRKQAESDLRYAPAEFEGKKYLVNVSGTIQKASSSSKSASRPDLGNGFRDFKDTSETIWTVDVNGIIQ